MHPIRLALIGIGKIARDQHLPAITGDAGFELVAAVSRNASVEGVAHFRDLGALIASGLAVDAVSLCTPPQGRHGLAAQALAAGWHVMLEKPPGVTVAEVQALQPGERTLFASWHSRAAAGVAPARAWLAGRRVRAVRIDWREDIRRWHPGQDWILEAAGMGVFDPGINALSILTAILPGPVRVTAARLAVPVNRSAPIAASLALACREAEIAAEFDFLQAGPQSWDIIVETDGGRLALHDGGARLVIDGVAQMLGDGGEYPGLYRRFAELIAAGRSDCDLAPLELVADALARGETVSAPSFDF
jgi:D-galactose 1-dehydrogenase